MVVMVVMVVVMMVMMVLMVVVAMMLIHLLLLLHPPPSPATLLSAPYLPRHHAMRCDAMPYDTMRCIEMHCNHIIVLHCCAPAPHPPPPAHEGRTYLEDEGVDFTGDRALLHRGLAHRHRDLRVPARVHNLTPRHVQTSRQAGMMIRPLRVPT